MAELLEAEKNKNGEYTLYVRTSMALAALDETSACTLRDLYETNPDGKWRETFEFLSDMLAGILAFGENPTMLNILIGEGKGLEIDTEFGLFYIAAEQLNTFVPYRYLESRTSEEDGCIAYPMFCTGILKDASGVHEVSIQLNALLRGNFN